MSKYSNLVEEIDKQEEVKEQKANLDNELQLLKQAISNLHDSIQKVEKASKDGTDMVKALNAAKDSMNTAVSCPVHSGIVVHAAGVPRRPDGPGN